MLKREFAEKIKEHNITEFLGLTNKEDILDAMEAIIEVRDTGRVNMFDFFAVRDMLYEIGQDWVAETFNKDDYEQYSSFICGNFDEI